MEAAGGIATRPSSNRAGGFLIDDATVNSRFTAYYHSPACWILSGRAMLQIQAWLLEDGNLNVDYLDPDPHILRFSFLQEFRD